MSPLPVGWGWWEAPRGPEVGVGSAACNHSSPGSLLWAPRQSFCPLSPQPSHAAPTSSLPSSTSLPAPSELPSWSPVTPLPLLPLSLPFPQPAPPSFNSLSFLTSASQPHAILPCPSLPCLIPGSPPSDPFLSDSARTGWGQGWGRAPQLPPLPSPPLFLYNLIKKRSRFCF